MKICVFTQPFLPKVGGQEIVVDQLAREYVRAGHEVVVQAQHSSWFTKPALPGLPYRLNWYRKPRSRHWALPVLRRSLLRLHREWPFDVIHCHKLYPGGYAALQTARACRVPLVVTSHDAWTVNADARQDRHWFPPLAWLRRRERSRVCHTLQQADAVTALSGFMQRWLTGLCPGCAPRLHAIPNGVDVERFAQPLGDAGEMARRYAACKGRFLLFMGRLAAIKRVDVLIEAFRTVAVANPELLLVIAGDGEQAGKLRERARGTNRIQFVGVVSGDDKVWLLQNALGLVLPSQVETFGLAALEAFAGGIPVVGTRVGGLAELIKPGVNGFLTNADDAAALARSLDELINSGGRLPRMRQGARETASHYAWNAVARQYLHVLESVVVPNCPRPADASRAT